MILLFDTFGETTYRAVQKYYYSHGYAIGYERIVEAVQKGKLTPESFRKNPVETVEKFLKDFFKARGGNQPQIWSEGETVYLKTERKVWCPSCETSVKTGINHREVCTIHKRALVIGIVKIFEDFFPGLVANCYNVSSRLSEENADCVEAYQIIYYK